MFFLVTIYLSLFLVLYETCSFPGVRNALFVIPAEAGIQSFLKYSGLPPPREWQPSGHSEKPTSFRFDQTGRLSGQRL